MDVLKTRVQTLEAFKKKNEHLAKDKLLEEYYYSNLQTLMLDEIIDRFEKDRAKLEKQINVLKGLLKEKRYLVRL